MAAAVVLVFGSVGFGAWEYARKAEARVEKAEAGAENARDAVR
ncbi:MAG TPA: hypothetical protein VH092_13710 [Urbifossiella sp.]|nr:hypothetical protein [Urbifossiella sp.]